MKRKEGRLIREIRQAVQDGRLAEPFDRAAVSKAGVSWSYHTSRNFLSKHCVGNSGGNTELFVHVCKGKYRLNYASEIGCQDARLGMSSLHALMPCSRAVASAYRCRETALAADRSSPHAAKIMHEMATLRAGREDHTNAASAPLLAWGVDGCPAGWFYFALDATGEYCYGIVEDLHEITDRANRQDRVLVDIPIGLRDGPRCCDLLARRRLGRRQFSVFPAPARAALQADCYDDACRRNQEATGKKLSKQTFNILPKVRAVDDLLLQDKRARAIVQEVHPELCFWALNDEVPMGHNKKAKARAGFKERMAVLEGCWKCAEAAAREVCACYPRNKVARDDIADAMVAALTARAYALKSLPEQPPVDAVGLPMRMVWAAKDAIRIGCPRSVCPP